MLKRAGFLTVLLCAAAAAVLPTPALAQDNYYGRSNPYYADRGGDRDWNRHEKHEWKEHERRERRAREWRENEWREQAWRAHEWRERERRQEFYDNGYREPGAYFSFGYRY